MDFIFCLLFFCPVGSCVGFENQRYFIVFCFYCAAAAIYGLFANYCYATLMYGPVSFSNFYHYILPVAIVEWLFGYADSAFLWCALLISVCFMTSTGSTGIFIWQFFIAVYGVTTFELCKRIKPRRRSILGPVRSVFGSYWMLNFIVPLTCIKQHGNGIEWEPVKAI